MKTFICGFIIGAAAMLAVLVLVDPERQLTSRGEETVSGSQDIIKRVEKVNEGFDKTSEDLARLSEATKMFTKIQEKMFNLYNPVLNKDLKEETPNEVAALFLEYSKYCPINPLSWTDEKGSHYRCRDTEAEIEAIIIAEKIGYPTRYPLVDGEIIQIPDNSGHAPNFEILAVVDYSNFSPQPERLGTVTVEPEIENKCEKWGYIYVRDDGDGYNFYFQDDAGKETRLNVGDGRP